MSSSKPHYVNREALTVSAEPISFSFGENWRKYLAGLNASTIDYAQKSFTAFTRLTDLTEHTFLDLGCGSGLSSLVAHRLGANKIVSVDVDPKSISCVAALRSRCAGNSDDWEILEGSVLDTAFLASLGQFSYVYSWGVLHHTGAMWQALDNATRRVQPGGKLHLALYNAHKYSPLWLRIKRACNRWPRTIFPLVKGSYALYGTVRQLTRFESPWRCRSEYQQIRGMDAWRDIEDWLGGLPYEYCKPGEVVDFLSDRCFVLLRLTTTITKGCNEFLFRFDGAR
jgi:2-polyprenyl-3-methyl-5-hydroxy-6-metoxy-1,4-benzoquinol methylase